MGHIRFNVLLESGYYIPQAHLRCNRGVIRDKRDLHNALKWEQGVIINNKYVSEKDIYEVEVA